MPEKKVLKETRGNRLSAPDKTKPHSHHRAAKDAQEQETAPAMSS